MRLSTEQADMITIIAHAAARYQLSADVALAFAWCESRFDPRAEGDLSWAERDTGKRYQRHVMSAVRLRENPARFDQKAWHSYGLFQLLAPYHVGDEQHPKELLDPELNAAIACKSIRSLLYRTGGDVEAARLLYVGLPLEGESTKTQRELVLFNLRSALVRFSTYATKPPDDGIA